MTGKFKVILAALVLLVGGGLAWIRYFHMETVTVTREVGWQGEAAKNRMLAAERFLTAMDIPVTGFRSFSRSDGLPDHKGVLIFATPRNNMGEVRQLELLDWAGEGGHLIVVATESGVGTNADPLMDAFSLGMITPEDSEDQDSDGDQDQPEQDSEELADSEESEDPEDSEDSEDSETHLPWIISLPDLDQKPLRVNLGPRRFEFIHEGDVEHDNILYWRTEGQGMALLMLAHGQGKVTFISTLNFLENDYIGDEDHANFFLKSISYNEREEAASTPSEVWLIRQLIYPSLRELLVESAWPVLLSLAVLVLISLWCAVPRFGPLEPDPPPSRRQLMEHVEAGAGFLWDHHAGEALIKTTRKAVIEGLRLHHPTWYRQNTDGRAKSLAAHTGLELESVKSALDISVVRDEETFRVIIQQLEIIRKSL